MGSVYEARQEPLERRVAIKTLLSNLARNEDAIARFFNEAKVLSRLEHACIVQVSDYGRTDDGLSYLVMEFLRGEPLSRRLQRLAEQHQRLPVLTVLQIAWQVADVLAIAHTLGIVHRDIKPENIMLVSDSVAHGGERVKVLDFGIAKLTQSTDQSALKTDTQAVLGTPMYMSPEQCSGAGKVDAKTDVYSLGCVVYEALAGQPPFQGEGAGELIGKHLFQTPAALSSRVPRLPSSISALVHRMLEKEKAQRISMSDAATELGLLISKLPGGVKVVRSRAPDKTDPEAMNVAAGGVLSTTLGHLTGQRIALPHRVLRKLAIGGGALLLASTILAWRTCSSAPSQPLSQPQVIVPKNSATDSVRWHIETHPTHASVIDETGFLLGYTPWTHSAAATPGKRSLRLRLDGYSEIAVFLDGGADFDETFSLNKAPTTTLSTSTKPSSQTPGRTGPKSAAPSGSTTTPLTPQVPKSPNSRKKIGYEK